MSDSKPTINISRGKKPAKSSTSAQTDASASSMPDATGVASGLAEGVRTIWLAGLGAVSMAEELGTKTFQSLVQEGKSWEAQNPPASAASDGESRIERLRKGGAEAVASLERRVRTEVSDMVDQMGIPRRQDVDALRDEVRDLSSKVDRLAEALDETDSDTAD